MLEIKISGSVFRGKNIRECIGRKYNPGEHWKN